LPVLLLSDHNLLLVLVWGSVLGLIEALGLVNLRIPALRYLHLLWNHNLSGWCHDLDGKGDDLTLTNLIPGLVLHEELEHIVDIDTFTVEGC